MVVQVITYRCKTSRNVKYSGGYARAKILVKLVMRSNEIDESIIGSVIGM